MDDAFPFHQPVMPAEVLTGLKLRPGAVIIDGTLGLGGHTALILEATAPDGLVIGMDRDAGALSLASRRLEAFGGRLITAQGSYERLPMALAQHGIPAVDGVLLDLGYSSWQVDDPARGFSFRFEGPLDMRYDASQPEDAAALLNHLSEHELANLIYRFGEERYSRRIARAIVGSRPLRTTADLAALIRASVPRSRERIDPATRTFQALRIAVNDELGILERTLPLAADALKPGGRLVVISFHSLEDRIVKHFMRGAEALEEVTRKPLTASAQEAATNPRARSAKLRVAERRPA